MAQPPPSATPHAAFDPVFVELVEVSPGRNYGSRWGTQHADEDPASSTLRLLAPQEKL